MPSGNSSSRSTGLLAPARARSRARLARAAAATGTSTPARCIARWHGRRCAGGLDLHDEDGGRARRRARRLRPRSRPRRHRRRRRVAAIRTPGDRSRRRRRWRVIRRFGAYWSRAARDGARRRRGHGGPRHRHRRVPRRRPEDLPRRLAGGAGPPPRERSGAHRAASSALAEVATALAERDRSDSTRAASPLAHGPDAIHIETTGVPIDAVVEQVLALVESSVAIPTAAAERGAKLSMPSLGVDRARSSRSALPRETPSPSGVMDAREPLPARRSLVVALALAAGIARSVGALPPRRRPSSSGRSGGDRRCTGVSRVGHSADRVERDQERPLEDRDPRPRLGVAGGLGRSGLRPDRGPAAARSAIACPARRAARRGVHRFVVMAINRKDGKVVWEQHAREAAAARGVAPGQRHLGLALRRHRRRARDRVVRVAGHLRLRHERQAGLGEGSRRQEDAQRVRRGIDAGAAQGQACSSSGTTRGTRSSSRSTSGPATSCGASSGTRSTPGPRRWSSSTAATRRSSPAR